MATVPSPRTWAVGELLTAAKLNADLRDGLNFLLAPPLAVLNKTAAQNILTGTMTAVTWESEQIDRDGGHSTSSNTSRYTVQTAGWYDLHAHLRWNNLNTNGTRYAIFRKGGSTDLPGATHGVPSPTGGYVWNDPLTRTLLSVGDYVEVLVHQDHGSTITLAYLYDANPDTQWEIRWVST